MRRTMISLRGFQPPRSSTHRNTTSASTFTSTDANATATAGDGARRTSRTATRSSSLVESPPRPGGHFSANRRLMDQAKATRETVASDGNSSHHHNSHISHNDDDDSVTPIAATTNTRADPPSQPERTYLELMLAAAAVEEAHGAGEPLCTHRELTRASGVKRPRSSEYRQDPASRGNEAKSSRHNWDAGPHDDRGRRLGHPPMPQDPLQTALGSSLSPRHGIAATVAGCSPTNLTPVPHTPTEKSLASGRSLFLVAFQNQQLLQPLEPQLSPSSHRVEDGCRVGHTHKGASPHTQPVMGENGNRHHGTVGHTLSPVCPVVEERLTVAAAAPMQPLLNDIVKAGMDSNDREEESEPGLENDQELAREAEEDLRLSEDLPFTPHRSGGGGSGGAASRGSQGTSVASSQAYRTPLWEERGPPRASVASLRGYAPMTAADHYTPSHERAKQTESAEACLHVNWGACMDDYDGSAAEATEEPRRDDGKAPVDESLYANDGNEEGSNGPRFPPAQRTPAMGTAFGPTSITANSIAVPTTAAATTPTATAATSPSMSDAASVALAMGRKRTVFIFSSSSATDSGAAAHEGSSAPTTTATAASAPMPTSPTLSAGPGKEPVSPREYAATREADETDHRPTAPTLPDLSQEEPPPPPLQLFLATDRSGGDSVRKRTCFTFTSDPAAAKTHENDDDSTGIEQMSGKEGAKDGVDTEMAEKAAAIEYNHAEQLENERTTTILDAPLPPSSHVSPFPLSPQPPQPVASTSAPPGLWYDLPPMVQALFASCRGVTKLYPWQHNLLSRPAIRNGGNFVYSMPTSGGKTLVAELSILRCIINRAQSAFFVVPFVSLAEEKTVALQPFGEVLGVAVDGHYGSIGRYPVPPAPAIFVCTIEKANSLLNHLLVEGREEELGAVVVDELHMLGEPRRGATLELVLSKLMVMNDRRRQPVAAVAATERATGHPPMGSALAQSGVASHNHHEPAVRPVQVIGMSATIPNLRTVATWLNAEIYEGTERPVPLREYSVVDGLVLRNGEVNERNLSGKTEVDHLFELAFESPDASVLVFCASRQQCVDTAKGLVLYAKRMAAANSPGLALTTAADQLREAQAQKHSMIAALRPNTSPAVRALVDDLQGLASSSEAALTELVPFGVAFHHGGLLAEEREAIESAYRGRLLRILCCTSTLAAGVNLPARRVIFKTPYVGREFLTKSRYLQMCGRAGRAGLDAYGESFLILSRRDRDRGHRLLRQSIEPCLSQMLEDASNLSRSLLECVTVGLVRSQREAVAGWGGHLLASRALGPIDVSFAAPLRTRFGEAAVIAHVGSGLQSARDEAASSTDAGTAVGAGDTACPNIEASRGLLEERSAIHSVRNDGSRLCEPEGGSEPAKEGSEQQREPRPVRPAEYLAGLQAHQPASKILAALLSEAVALLSENGLVRQAKREAAAGATAAAAVHTNENDEEENAGINEELLVGPTPFGASAVRSCFSVEEALLVRDELENLRTTGLILGDDLHLCYFLTPLREVGDCDWRTYTYLYAQLTESQQRIANLLGVSERFITMRAMGLGGGRNDHAVPTTVEGKRDFFTARRFFVALMLSDVLSEVPMDDVEARYNVNRGQLQSLMRSASMFSSSITSFCHAMEWFSLEAVLASFVKRLGFGVKPDLVPLMEIRSVQPGRARALWNAGFKTPTLVASCEDPDEMVRKVKASNAPDSKSAKFFTRRAAFALIRQANLLLESQIREKKEELQLLTRKPT